MFRLESLHIFIFVSFFLLSFLHHNRLVNHVASCHTKRGYVFGLLHHYFFVRISSEKHVYKLLGRRADKAACGPAGRGVFHPAAGAVNSSSSVWGGAGGTRTPHACPSTCSPAASERDAHGGREQSSTLCSRENTRELARTRSPVQTDTCCTVVDLSGDLQWLPTVFWGFSIDNYWLLRNRRLWKGENRQKAKKINKSHL